MPFWGRILAAHGIAVAGARGLEDLRAVDGRGRAHEGPDAYRFVFRRLPWAGPFWLLSIVFRRSFDAGYRLFARNRYRVSALCQRPRSLRSAARPSS